MSEMRLNFVQISDIHLRPPANRSGWWLSREPLHLLRSALDRVRTLPELDFVLFSGDLLDRAEIQALDQFQQAVRDLPCPHYICVGNHDVSTQPKAGQLSKREFARRLQLPARLYYSVQVKPGFRLVLLDSVSGEYHHAPGGLQSAQLAWLADELADHRHEVVVIAMHHPPIASPNPYDTRFQPTDALSFGRLIAGAANVACVLNGHLHVPRRWHDYQRPFFSAPALGGPPNAMRQFRLEGEGGRLRLDYDWLPILPEGRRPFWYPLSIGGRADRQGTVLLTLPAPVQTSLQNRT